jgi:hypothetical protein
MCEMYNGWPNYPTWVAFSWLANIEEDYLRVTRMLRNTLPREREEWLKSYLVAYSPSVAGLYADLLGWGIASVDLSYVVNALMKEDDNEESDLPVRGKRDGQDMVEGTQQGP